MGKKSGNSWLNAVKKAFRSPTNENEKRSSRRREEEDDPEGEEVEKKRGGKKRWMFRRHSTVETTIQHNAVRCANSSAVRTCSGEENLVRKQPKTTETSAAEQRRVFSVAVAKTAAAEAAVATAVEIIRHTGPAVLVKQEKATLVIQKNFRGYLARRALMALRGVVKLQAIIRGHNVRKRAKLTLECIQSLIRVQSLVCDQRRRLSCDIFTTKISSRNSSREVEEIHALIHKAKECSLKQGKTLSHALSHQISDDQISDKSYPWMRKDGSLCSVEVDVSSRPPFHGRNLNLSLTPSPRTPPSSSKIRSIPCSPCYQREGRKYEEGETPTWRRRMSMSENSRPNYMAATASAMARVSTPRQRLSSSPCRETTGLGSGRSAKKRLSFPAYDGYESNLERCRGGVRSDMPYYGTD